MVQVGDDVVVMSAAGRFKVVAVSGSQVTIENKQGVRKTVLAPSLRPIAKQDQKPA